MRRAILAMTAVACLTATGWAQVATVDGVGGVGTGDALYPNSYATINAALVDVRTNETAAGTTINVTTSVTTETAGLNLNLNHDLKIQSTLPAGTNVRITPSGIGLAAASAAMVANVADNKSITLKGLIITPTFGAGGPQNSRAIQIYGRNSTPAAGTTYNVAFENCYFTAIKANSDTVVLDPFTHNVSADTIAARNSELRAFDGGGANNAIEFRFVGAAESNSSMTLSMKNTVITHTCVATGSNKGGGIAVSRSRNLNLDILEGCVISYNGGSGIRGVGTLQSGTTFFRIQGTATNPVFFIKNGWMEDTVNTARNEHIQNDGSQLDIEHAYFIGSFQEAIDKLGAGAVTISNSYFAESQTDLDTTNGTAPNVANGANLKMSGSANVTVTKCTIFDNKATTNDQAIAWTAPAAGNILSLSNVICAGAGDQLNIGAANAVTYNEDDCAIVQAGSHSLESPFITFGAGVTQNVTDRLTADPQFLQTTFTPTFAGLGVKPTGLTNYLAVGNPAYLASGSRADVAGANPDSPFPVSVSRFSID